MARRSGSEPARLLVLGAGAAQFGLLEAASARGIHVIAADRDPSAPGFGSESHRHCSFPVTGSNESMKPCRSLKSPEIPTIT